MLGRIMAVAVALAFPAALAAQDIPNAHASETAKAKVAVAQHHATQIRGAALGTDNRPVTPATPAVRATPATRATPGAGGATPATPATPAVPASPSKKPTSPGQSGGHRP